MEIMALVNGMINMLNNPPIIARRDDKLKNLLYIDKYSSLSTSFSQSYGSNIIPKECCFTIQIYGNFVSCDMWSELTFICANGISYENTNCNGYYWSKDEQSHSYSNANLISFW